MGTKVSLLMAKRYYLLLLAILVIVPFGPVLAKAGQAEQPMRTLSPADDVELPPYGYYKGTLPVPYDGQSFEEAYLNASKNSQFVPVWGRPTPFYDMAGELSGPWGDMFVDDMIRGNGMFPVVHLNFYGAGMTLVEPPGMSSSNLSSRDWRKAYHDSALEVLNVSRPMYMSIGNEVNRWFEAHGAVPGEEDSFLDYISLYSVIYDDIKEVSPDTKVFCTFSREIVSENREADLSVLSLFDPSKLDLLVFTSYPHSLMGVDHISDLPDDYYERAFDLIDKMPIGFSELGWPSRGPFGGEEGQAAFVRNMTGRLTLDQGLDLELLGWCWSTDLNSADSTGLIERTGRHKKAFSEWADNSPPSFNRSERFIHLAEDFGLYSYDLGRTFFDPDPWDVLRYGIWNGSAYVESYGNSMIGARINGTYLELSSMDNRSGTAQLRVQAQDWGGLTNWTFLQVVIDDVNDPPALTADLEGALSLDEDDFRFYDMGFYIRDDSDGIDELTMDVVMSPELVVEVNLSISPYMTVRTEESDWWGSTFMLFRVLDSEGLYLEANLSVPVGAVNDPPVLDCPPYVETKEDTPLTRDISLWVTDVDLSDPLLIEVSVNDPKNVSARLEDTVMTLLPGRDWHGIAMLEMVVSDGSEIARCSMEVRVVSVNDPPTADRLANMTVNEDSVPYLPLTGLNPSDPDGDLVHWKVMDFSHPVVSASVLPNLTLMLRLVRDGYGSTVVNLTLDDGKGGEFELTLYIEVLSVNDPPVLRTPDPWTVSIKRGGSALVDMSGEDYLIEDPDDPASSLSIVTDSDLCRVEGHRLNVSVPGNLMVKALTVHVRAEDPHGAFSDPCDLVMTVVNGSDQSQYRLRVTDVTYELHGGDGGATFHAKGAPGQAIWVVLKGEKGVKASFMMEERPPGSGNYSAVIDDLPFEDGERVAFHLSLTEDGPNDSLIPISSFTYSLDRRDSEESPSGMLLAMLLLAVLALTVLVGYLLIWRKGGRNGAVDALGPLEE